VTLIIIKLLKLTATYVLISVLTVWYLCLNFCADCVVPKAPGFVKEIGRSQIFFIEDLASE